MYLVSPHQGFLVLTPNYNWGENKNLLDTCTCNAKPSGTKEIIQELDLKNYLTDGAQWTSSLCPVSFFTANPPVAFPVIQTGSRVRGGHTAHPHLTYLTTLLESLRFRFRFICKLNSLRQIREMGTDNFWGCTHTFVLLAYICLTVRTSLWQLLTRLFSGMPTPKPKLSSQKISCHT